MVKTKTILRLHLEKQQQRPTAFADYVILKTSAATDCARLHDGLINRWEQQNFCAIRDDRHDKNAIMERNQKSLHTPLMKRAMRLALLPRDIAAFAHGRRLSLLCGI